MRRSSHFALRSIKRKRIPDWPIPCIFWRSSLSPISKEAHAKPIYHIQSQTWAAKRAFSSSASTPAIPTNHEDQNVISKSLPLQNDQLETESIRHRLRSWEPENLAGSDLDLAWTISANKSYYDTISLRLGNDREVNEETKGDAYETDPTIIEDGELVNFGNQRAFLFKGDLVELRTPGFINSKLAILVRQIGKESLFYGMSGNFILEKPKGVLFFVPRFVDPCELDELPEMQPSDLESLDSFEDVLPCEVGSTLRKKMFEFRKQSDECYRAAASKLDYAHQLLARKSTMRYANLQEIAHELLGENFMHDGQYTAPMLYALHRCLLENDSCFRPQRSGLHRTWGQFEIVSTDDRYMFDFVTKHVRRYQAHLAAIPRGDKLPPPRRFLNFLATARRLIDESRETRILTPFGTIGPPDHTNENQVSPEDLAGRSFKGEDNLFIRFILAWAGLEIFGIGSHLHSIASTILRATGKYEDQILDRAAGWTFLQEIGVIAPWENKVQFDLRLSEPEPNRTESDELGPDMVESLRKDWGNLPVYCIDESNALEIDDGVSVEAADLPDEYWVHIHTADPAARVVPRSVIGKRAESLIRSVYLPERKISLLPAHVVHENFSLAPNRPCLTFSARLNRHGDILEEKITPGIIRNVVYMTPGTLSSVIGENMSTEETVIAWGDGENRKATIGNRPMLIEQDITGVDKENLILLDCLGSAHEALASTRGAMFIKRAEFTSAVDLDRKAMSVNEDQFTSHRQQSDPYMELRAYRWDLENTPAKPNTTKNLMLIAGQVAARWCHARGIPIINHATQFNPDRPDPREVFRNKILPNLPPVGSPSYGIPSPNMLEYMGLIGHVLPSTTVGPHVQLGLDMFARATSPLRRYTDLVLHWQVEAALLEEKRLGKSLAGSSGDNYLPFTKDQLDKLLPYLDNKERALASAHQEAYHFWAVQVLFRVWKFDPVLLPSTFDLVVKVTDKHQINGELRSLSCMRAIMEYPDWMDADDINIGDVFEVKIVEINVYRRRILVEGLRVLESSEAGAG